MAKAAPARAAAKVPKPYPDFPLFAHANGCWRKKIAGKQPSFGPVAWPDPEAYEASWRAALTAYHRHLEANARGLAIAADPRSIELTLLIDAYLAAKHADAEAGTLKPRTFGAFRLVLREYRAALGPRTTVGELEARPQPLHAFIASLHDRYGFHAFNRLNRYIRTMWNWAAKPEVGLLDRPFKWAMLHTKKPIKEFRKQRRLERAAGVFKTFEADEVAALIATADPFVRAIVLLGYFAGHGNTDVATLPRTAVKVYERDELLFVRGRPETIPAGWALIDFPRPKTEIDRCAIVPPVVVDAIRAVQAMKDRPATAETRDLIFRTTSGRPLVYDVVHRDASELIEKTSPVDTVGQKFEALVAKLGRCGVHGWTAKKAFVRGEKLICSRCRPSAARKSRAAQLPREPDLPAFAPMRARGFYCLRHTATTFAAGSGASSDARNLFEGHGGGGVRQTFYLDPTKLHDLLLIARDLMKRLEDPNAASGSAGSVPASPAADGSALSQAG